MQENNSKINNLSTKFLFIPARQQKCCYGYKCESDSSSIHTRSDNLRVSLPHLNPIVFPESLYMANEK